MSNFLSAAENVARQRQNVRRDFKKMEDESRRDFKQMEEESKGVELALEGHFCLFMVIYVSVTTVR